VGGSVALLVAALAIRAYDPSIDKSFGPSNGVSIGVGVQRLQDDFGIALKVASPRFLDNRLTVGLVGGVGWYPDLRALPMNVEDQSFGQWSLYGHARLLAEASTSIAFAASRLYATLGPSALLLSKQLSTRRLAFGVFGAVGVELFAGDELRAYPFAIYLEIGAVAHAASADVKNRVGQPVMTEATVDRSIATGLALGGGVRIYLWR
jgi:hypothetical protein